MWPLFTCFHWLPAARNHDHANVGATMDALSQSLGRRLAQYLLRSAHVHSPAQPADLARLRACLRPGDVLLVEGNSRVSAAIKYLTHSTWPHAALYGGPMAHLPGPVNSVGDGRDLELRQAADAHQAAVPMGAACAAEFNAVMAEVLAGLPPRQAQTFLMTEVWGMDTAEVCAALGVTPSHLWVLRHRARQRLRQDLHAHADR